MSRLPEEFQQDKALRDAALAVLVADIEHARVSLSGKAVAARVVGTIGDGARDALEVAKGHADDNRGFIAALIAALALWLARVPLLEILGLREPDGEWVADTSATDDEPNSPTTPSPVQTDEPSSAGESDD
ncbi:MAG: hypothetical protein AAGH57_07210 [Pseudomonadota bacterium]